MKITEVRANIIEKVLNSLGKREHISVFRTDYWEDGAIDKDGDAILKFDVNWPCRGLVPASQAASFAKTMSVVTDIIAELEEMNLGVMISKDQFIDSSYKKMEQFDYFYHAIQCSLTKGTELLKKFAAGEIYVENGIIR